MQWMLRTNEVQAKMAINEPGDKYEQEADLVAEQVMSMHEPAGRRYDGRKQAACPAFEERLLIQSEPKKEMAQAGIIANQIRPLIQRQAELEDDRYKTRTERKWGEIPLVSSGLEARIHSLRGEGEPLPGTVRKFFEPRFGYNFSQVQVHAGNSANELANDLNARAFALGRNVVFGSGEYITNTREGRHLLAHELAHVVHQTGKANSRQRTPFSVQRQQKGEKAPETSAPKAKEVGELRDIKEVLKFFKAGDTATVTDIETAKSYNIKARSVDASHADVYPLTAADTQILRDIYGFKGEFAAYCTGSSSKLWNRRAIIITIDADPTKGRKIAASQHGCPHGFGKSGKFNFTERKSLKDRKEDNAFPGHFCIHFLHSKGHNAGEDAQHQEMVYKAAGKEPPKSQKKKIAK